MKSRVSSTVVRLIVLAAMSVAAAAAVVFFTPRLWQSTAHLMAAGEAFDSQKTVTAMHSGVVLTLLTEDPEVLAAFGLTPGEEAAPAISLILTEQVTAIAGDGEVWVWVRDRDGDRAHLLAAAIVEAVATVEVDIRKRWLGERAEALESSVVERSERLEELIDVIPDSSDVVATEVWQARLREAASRLAVTEENLHETRRRLQDLAVPWIMADPPRSFQHAIPRRLAPLVTAALMAPLLLVCVAMLLSGRIPGP